MPLTHSDNDAAPATDGSLSRRTLLHGAAGAAMALGTAAEAAGAQGLLAGAAKRIITPDPLLPVSGGMGPTNPVKEKRGDLTVRALYLRKGAVGVAVVGLDLLGFPGVLGDRVRARVPRLPAANILIGATHAHSAPDCYAFPDLKGGHTGDLAYIDHVCTLAAEAINEAIDRAQPAHLRTASGEARGKIAYNYYAPDLYDRGMGVLQAVTPGGKAIATLVNYAIHPEVLGSEVGILSPDLCGPLYDRIEERIGGMALFMNSAQGGMVTADNRYLDRPSDPQRGYWEDARTWEECLRIGHTMADEALRILGKAATQEDPNLYCRGVMVTLPVQSPELWMVVTRSPLHYPHGKDRTIKARVNLLNIGDMQVVTVPGEALPNIGLFTKRHMRGRHNLLFGLTNEAFGYILSRVDYKSFDRYKYVSAVSLGEMTGEILMDRWLQLIRTSPAPDGR